MNGLPDVRAGLLHILKFNPYHDKIGRFTTANGRGSGKGKEPGEGRFGGKASITTGNVDQAARALAAGKKVKLTHTRQVSTLLDKLAGMVADANAKGAKAPNFNLCNVSVKGTNLFCSDSKGIPRVQMPQLSGKPLPGSKGAKLADAKGEVDLTDLFRQHLLDTGSKITDTTEQAAYLKASQNELNGAKVAGMTAAMLAGKIPDQRLFISEDNYIVDGHHRWAAKVGMDAKDGKLGDISMPVARVNVDIITLLSKANQFASDYGIPQANMAENRRAKKADCGCGGT